LGLHPGKHTFAPRLGAAYSVDPKTIIRAGFGQFYSQIFSDLGAQVLFPGYTISQSFNSLGHGRGAAVFAGAGDAAGGAPEFEKSTVDAVAVLAGERWRGRRSSRRLEKFHEYRLTLGNPLLAPFDRYGVKDRSPGSFNGITVRTRTGYAEKKEHHTQVTFIVHLTGVPGSATDLSALETPISDFLVAVDSDPVFAAEVRAGSIPGRMPESRLAGVITSR
jgi:hypothetical protein